MPTLGPRSFSALRRFEAHPLVEDVKLHWDRLRIVYRTGIREVWGLHGGKGRRLMFPRSDWWRSRLEILSEFGHLRPITADAWDPTDPLFAVPSAAIREGGFLDRRLFVQEVVKRLAGEGWIHPDLPDQELQRDIGRLEGGNRRYVLSPGALRSQCGRGAGVPAGFALSAHCFDWGLTTMGTRPSLSAAWTSPRRLYWGVESLLRRGQDVTRLGVIHAIMCGRAEGYPEKAGPRWDSPAVWRSILQDVLCLGPGPVVLDVDLGIGVKAVAVASLGGTYLHAPSPLMASGAGRLMAIFGTEARLAEDHSDVDVAILTGMEPVDVETVCRRYAGHRRCARTLLAVVALEDEPAVVATCPVKGRTRVRPFGFSKTENVLLHLRGDVDDVRAAESKKVMMIRRPQVSGLRAIGAMGARAR